MPPFPVASETAAERLVRRNPDPSLLAAGGGGPPCLTCPLLREET